MKTILILLFILMSPVLTGAQTLEEGKKQFHYERYQSAEASLHRVLHFEPNNAEAWAMLMRTYIRLGKFTEASDTFSLAPESIRSEPFYRIAEGALLLKANSSLARSKFQEALHITKGKNIHIIATIADVNIESPHGDYQYAAELLKKALKKNKGNASLHSRLGKAFRKQHNGTEAYKAFREAIEKNAKETVAYYELGRLFLSQKNTELYTSYFLKAIESDPNFSPAYYALYNHYLYLNPAKAKEYFHQYMKNSDHSLQRSYSYTDLLYLTKNYDSAILAAKQLVMSERTTVQPRLYKLIGYSYQEKRDTGNALNYMREYFAVADDSNRVMKDYETMAYLYSRIAGKKDSAVRYFKKALALATSPATKIIYYKQLANLTTELNDHAAAAYWLGQIYCSDPGATNVTLFNWGLAAYKAQDYQQADSVFGLYTAKYADQGYGYFWRARSNAAIDTTMEYGLAVPHYLKLIEVIESDTLTDTNKKWLQEAYGYLASYEANTQKDYTQAIDLFEKILEIDPANTQVQRNIEILEKNLSIRNKPESESN